MLPTVLLTSPKVTAVGIVYQYRSVTGYHIVRVRSAIVSSGAGDWLWLLPGLSHGRPAVALMVVDGDGNADGNVERRWSRVAIRGRGCLGVRRGGVVGVGRCRGWGGGRVRWD